MLRPRKMIRLLLMSSALPAWAPLRNGANIQNPNSGAGASSRMKLAAAPGSEFCGNGLSSTGYIIGVISPWEAA